METILAGPIAAAALFFLLLKIDIRKALGYAFFIDLTFTALLAYMLAGTYSGMMAALLGGAILSILLSILKFFIGYKTLTIKGWVYHPPYTEVTRNDYL